MLSQVLSARDLYPGLILGKLTLLGKVRSGTKGCYNTRHRWRVRCECGNKVTIPQFYLVRDPHPRRSCGECGKSIKVLNKREYIIWLNMRRRCTVEDHVAYKYYGGRGITVAEEWMDLDTGFDRFLAHVGNAPSLKHTLDRIDVEGNYEPGNVRWATADVQAKNTRAYLKKHARFKRPLSNSGKQEEEE
jgi:hypothetical protein